jgi:hypothetical protein
MSASCAAEMWEKMVAITTAAFATYLYYRIFGR